MDDAGDTGFVPRFAGPVVGAQGAAPAAAVAGLVQPPDLSPFRIEHFVSAGQEIQCSPPLDLAVEFEPETGILTAASADLGIEAHGETRDRLSASLNCELDTLWRYYATADPAELAEDAVVLRKRLRERFRTRGADEQVGV